MVSSHAEYPIDVFEEDLILRHAMACLLNTVREALTISVGVTAAWLGGALLLYAHGAGAVTDIDTGTGAASASGTNAGFVSLYGVIDTSVEITDPGSGWVARMDSGAYRGSRVGLHGAEPLGGGNAIVFTLENGFGSTDGSLQVPGSIFNRQAWIGASGGWGELRFGRQYSPNLYSVQGRSRRVRRRHDRFGAQQPVEDHPIREQCGCVSVAAHRRL
ncbi:hypothetical protein OKW34_001793 [Paraburkholderia youngii]